MSGVRELEGMEFDWFAGDENGSFALFSTAGAGPIPEMVRGVVYEHDAIGDSIDVTDVGSNKVWNSYSRVGLYVYDWSDGRGGYVRLAVPTGPMSTELEARLRNTKLHHFAMSFRATEVVSGSMTGLKIGEDFRGVNTKA